MVLVYSICYYYDAGKTINILNHQKCFESIKSSEDDIFVITCMTDDMSKRDKISRRLKQILKVKHEIIIEYNWGGTIVGLWLVYKHFKKFPLNIYVSHYEEDFLPIDVKTIEESKKLLEYNPDFIYIGECQYNKINIGNDQGRLTKKRFKNATRLGDPEVWTDGGFYFTTIGRLIKMYEAIGIFHKGNPNNKYNHDLDGIDIGEVGFPTLLHHAGFKFGFLNRKDYFINHGN